MQLLFEKNLLDKTQVGQTNFAPQCQTNRGGAPCLVGSVPVFVIKHVLFCN